MTGGTYREGRHQQDNYWVVERELGEALLGKDRKTIRLSIHRAEERYFDKHEIVPLTSRNGHRIYVHGKPYVLQPDVRVAVGLYTTPMPNGLVGEVLESHRQGLVRSDIGNAQACCYPADRLAVIWECYLHDRFRQPLPCDDSLLRLVWNGFERVLVEEIPEFDRFITIVGADL